MIKELIRRFECWNYQVCYKHNRPKERYFGWGGGYNYCKVCDNEKSDKFKKKVKDLCGRN